MSATNVVTDTRYIEEAAQWSLRLAENPSAQETRDFQVWLAADAANREAFESLGAVMGNIEHFAGAPEVVNLRGQALVIARRARRTRLARAFLSSYMGRAAGIAFLAISVGAACYWWYAGNRTIATDIGERRVVAMPDGSSLSLDAATEVDVSYSDERRRFVLERGRAKFDVAKDPLRPFTVAANGRIVVATGTSFSIELLKNQMRVALYEGRVEILSSADDAPGKIVLDPGYELILEPHRPPQRVALDVQRSLAWESGDLAFTDEPLSFAVERVNRYAKPGVRIGDEAAGQVRISGIFHAGDTAAFIDGVTRLFPVRAERSARATVLLLNHSDHTK